MEPLSYGWPLRRLGNDVWTASVPIRFAGAWMPHVMTVIRLPDGSLALHSPCRLSEALASSVSTLGPVRHIIAPNWFHDLYLAQYKAAYPLATFWGPRFLQKLKGADLIEKTFDNSTPWIDVMPHYTVRGLLTFDESMFFHRPTNTLIVADLLMNLRLSADAPLFTNVALRLFRANGHLCVFPLLRLAFADRRSLRHAASQMLAWEPQNVIVGHGFPIEGNAGNQLATALRWLVGK